AMESVGAGLDRHIDHAAQIVAEIRRRISGDQVEFLNSIGRGNKTYVVVIRLVVVHAVENEIVLLLSRSVHIRPPGAERVLRGLEAEQVGGDHAWVRNQSQLVGVVRGKRELLDVAALKHAAEQAGISL